MTENIDMIEKDNKNELEEVKENVLREISKACSIPVRFLRTPELGTVSLQKKYRISLRRAIIEGMIDR